MQKVDLSNPLVQIGFKCPLSLCKKIEEETQKRRCSKTDFLIALIEEHFNKEVA